ncbi:MAG: tetratricopeptide repeat protein [Anaerolineae bacterium]|nr:tetratricopeptide repeat protein [Anaerolineae bacterium]
MRKPWYQKIVTSYLPWVITGFLFVGSILDTLSNAVDWIPPTLTYIGTLIILLIFLSAQIFLRRSPILWVTSDGQEVYIKSLGLGPLLILGGILAALWLPRLVNTATPTATQFITSTATPDETLILVADFNDESSISFDAAGRIKVALDEALGQYNLFNVRLERLHKTFRQDELKQVKEEGERYNATIFIWGHYDDFGFFPRFTILKPEKLDYLPEELPDNLINLSVPPDDFTLYVNHKLPDQMRFLTQFTVAQIFFLRGDFSKALTIFDETTDFMQDVGSEQFQQSLAMTYFYKGFIYEGIEKDQNQAISNYSKAIELDPNLVPAYVNRGVVYLLPNHYSIKLDLNNSGLYVNPHDSGEIELAIQDFTHAIELNPNFAPAYIGRGGAYQFSGDFNKAIQDFTHAIELNPNFAPLYVSRGSAYQSSGDFNKAIQDYTKAIEIDTDSIQAYSNRASAYNASGELDKALQDYTQAIELDPDSPENADAYVDRANFFKDTGKLGLAISDFDKAIEVAPEYAIAYLHRGNFYRNSGNFEQAIIDYTQTINLNPNLAEAYLHRGNIYKESSEKEKAISDFERYLELAPNGGDREDVMDWIRQLKIEPK